ncbi:hypothetical protein DICSQDRAFT_145066 [Dichomitus squalens LYAD-421 SS1]|uniref:uncharacterized protein n=1 Tax=Dichomitus squalens (strain LYAD-421) TaxID=732165 RepID=UPI0004411390|nr:uncharacterized protein DICSQDRAFT_145066 [Dichomitus squalens LYAD-421 SS1]EJF64433.1 hypothetical protein DICSQDRAFT_145066 [Dichomitus squalens LYAD-421 SS1]
MDMNMELIRKTALKVISQVVKEGKLQQNSLKAIRRNVEDAMDLAQGALDEAPYKSAVKDVVQDYIATHDEGASAEDEEKESSRLLKNKMVKSFADAEPKPTKPRQSRPSASNAKVDNNRIAKQAAKGKKSTRSPSVVPTSDEDVEGNPTAIKPKVIKRSTGPVKRVDSENEASEADEPEPPVKRQRTTTPSKEEQIAISPSSPVDGQETLQHKSSEDEQHRGGDGEKSESEMSVLIDDELPVRKRKKKAETSTGEKGTGGRKRKEPAKELSKDEETIKRLKSLVVACGVRKVWSKEFKDLDKPSDQIRRLRQILTDLGMSRRMSMEQAKAIKEKREFEKELEDVQEFAQKFQSAGRRHRLEKSTAAKSEPLDSSDIEVAPKRRPTARQSIMAFLGDEESE